MSVVLIVEDHESIRMVAESILQRAGHQTFTAATVEEALAIIHSKQDFDLCFTDIALGTEKEGGLRVGEEVSKARPGLPVLYTSGGAISAGTQTAPEFLPKPYSCLELLTRSRRCRRPARAQLDGQAGALLRSGRDQ